MKPVWILARMTFHEAFRRRIVLTGLVLGVCFLIVFSIGFHMITGDVAHITGGANSSLNPNISRVAQVEGINTLLLAGLYAVTFLAIAMAALLGADTLAGEIGSGAIQTVVTKPIRRSAVVFGKWLGFAGLLALYCALIAAGTMASVWLQAGYTAPHFLAGLGLIYLEALLIMTVAMACSSRFTGLATGAVVFGLWGIAFIGGWVEQFGAMIHNTTAIQVGIFTSLLIPSETFWRRAAFEMQSPLSGVLGMSPFGTTSVPSPLSIVYGVIYIAIALFVALRIFSRRDL